MDTTFALFLLTHPFQVALLLLTLGAVVREALSAVAAERKALYWKADGYKTDVRAPA